VANMLISIGAAIVLAVLFHAWLRGKEDRHVQALLRWADSTGWRVRTAPARSTLPASWPEYPPAAWGNPLVSLDGERDGYPLVVEWILGDEWVATVCYATLRRNHPTSTLRRKMFARRLPPQERFSAFGNLSSTVRDVLSTASVDSWQLSGRHLAAMNRDWLGPTRIDALISEVIAAGTAIDGSARPLPACPRQEPNAEPGGK